MILKTAKSMALTALLISTSGCQLLIDNRSRESGAVVVVPSAEWDAMRQASLAASEEPVNDEPSEMPAALKPAKITPTPGSEAISFTNYTGANLGGCATIGIIEMHHRGDMDDAITLLKNEAFRLNSNLLVPMQMNSERTDDYNMISIEARMLTCPLKLARGN
ncbi:hypothetical protein N9Y31_02715 [Alphaproteobacteria bacterium]|nr:hypothetical protein [Alphaproteobacteria bacterium]